MSVFKLPKGERFLSIAAFRSTHNQLLKRHRKYGDKSEVMSEITEFIKKGRLLGDILENEDDRCSAQSILDYWNSLLYRAGIEPPDATLEEFDLSVIPELSDDLCPYVGLAAFSEKNADLFFGREKIINSIVDLIKNCQSSERIFTIVGAANSGKSSIVVAGVLPKLKEGEVISGSENWHYYSEISPGNNPLASLAFRLKPPEEAAETWISQQVELFQKNHRHLAELVDKSNRQPAVLIIERFGEIFTLCQSDSIQEAYIQNLIEFTRTSRRNILILLIRTDFEDRLVRLPDLYALFDRSHIRITALDASQMREAIEEPAKSIGLTFEPGLVEEIVGNVLGEPDALPTLQFILLNLWKNRDRNRITWEAYRRLGGREILIKSAEDFYQSLTLSEKETFKNILLRTIRLESSRNRLIDRTPLADLYRGKDTKERVDPIVDRLVQLHILQLSTGNFPDDSHVEIGHESLIRYWPRFEEWIDEYRVEKRKRSKLTAAANEWQSRKKNRDLLWHGFLLDEAKEYRDLSKLESDFIKASDRRKKSLIIINISLAIILFSAAFYVSYLHERLDIEFECKESQRAENIRRKKHNLPSTSRTTNPGEWRLDRSTDREPNARIYIPTGGMVNFRKEPGHNSGIITDIKVGERVKILCAVREKDWKGRPWYKVYSPRLKKEGWILAEFVKPD